MILITLTIVLNFQLSIAQDKASAFATIDSNGNKKWGCLNKTTLDTVLPPIYDYIERIVPNGARYRLGQNWGLLNSHCQVVFAASEHRHINRYYLNNQYFWVVVDTNYKSGLFSSEFEEVLSMNYEFIKPLNHMIVAVKKDSLVGLMDSTFKLILPYEYSAISILSGGYAKISKGNKVGFIAPNGSIVLDANYNSSSWLVENRLAVNNGKRFGYVDSTGKLVIPYWFLTAQNFNNGLAAVYCHRELDNPPLHGSNLHPQVGVINTDGKWILSPKFKHAIVGHKYGLVEVVNNDKSSMFFDPDTLNPLPDYWYSTNTIIGLGKNIDLVLVMNQLEGRYAKKEKWPYFNSNTWEKDKKYLVMDASGDTLLKNDYRYACYDSTTIYLKNAGKWKYFDGQKLKVRSMKKHPEETHIVYGRSYDEAPMGYGVIGRKGRLIIPFSFKSITYDGENYICKKTSKTLIFTESGSLNKK
ncbi:MAG: WG repeat-containing protein [Salibacteraceae bacterium]